MTSTSSNINNVNNELASFYSAFRADDTLIDIIPAFDYSYNHDHNNSNSNSRRNNSNDDEYDNDITNLFQSTLSSTSIFGGGSTNQNHVKAGLTYTVPIWMAILLQQRSFATMVYPTDVWYNIPNLKYILLYEKTNVSLFHTTTSTSTDTNDTTTTNSLSKPPRRNRHDDDDDDDETTDNNNHNNETTTSITQQQSSSIKNNNYYYLPSNYFELAMRFKSSMSTNMNTTTVTTTSTTTTTTMNHIDVLTLLIQDIYDIRMDKLRQQFQTLLYDTTKHIAPPQPPSTTSSTTTTTPNNRSSYTTDLIINVTGIGTQELTQIQSYVLQAMNDIYYLES